MKIIRISADEKTVTIYTEGDGPVMIRESTPVIRGGTTVAITRARAEGGVIVLPRYSADGVHDSLFSRFTVYEGSERVPGPVFVSEIAPESAENNSPYPTHKHIKAINASPETQKKMFRVEQGRPDVSLPGFMTLQPEDGDIEFIREGRTYYFRAGAVAHLDEYMRAYDHSTFILLNSSKGFGSRDERGLLDVCLHPKYDEANPSALISAFNMESEDGLGYYAAFVEFLVKRYTRPDGKYGRAAGAIIGNEIDQQGIWGNAGDMTVAEYISEYSEAMRLAWQIGRKYCSHFRVYISLTNNWSIATPGSPLRFYTAKECIEQLAAQTSEQGDFDWHVAYHPYPENLFWPDFWHDRAATFSYNTPHISFRNMEVLESFLSQKRFLYNGKPRRIVFSEQGFNSMTGPLARHSELDGEAGVVLAYMKARNMKTVDMFTHHSSVDNPGEFGLNLGLIRHNGEPKPDYYAFMAMDTDKEPEYVAKARARIGEDLFDYLLSPEIEDKPKTDEDELNESIMTNSN